MPRLFDAYVIVRWSAASKAAVGADSVLIGLVRRDVRFRNAYSSQSALTRAEGEQKLVAILDDLAKRNEKVLLCLDFPLGFPRGLAAGLKLAGEPWQALWTQLTKMVKDKPDNTNNRFAVGSEINRRVTDGPFPFWGCPPRDTLTTLQPKRTHEHGPGDLPEFRLTETRVKGAPSVWKLYYNGSIGGHAILGVPMVRRLQQKYGDAMKAWPFETGWGAPDLSGVQLVAAEVFTLGAETKPAANESKDQTEIRAYAEQIAKLDDAGKLAPLFDAPKGVSATEAEVARSEEGWILGA